MLCPGRTDNKQLNKPKERSSTSGAARAIRKAVVGPEKKRRRASMEETQKNVSTASIRGEDSFTGRKEKGHKTFQRPMSTDCTPSRRRRVKWRLTGGRGIQRLAHDAISLAQKRLDTVIQRGLSRGGKKDQERVGVRENLKTRRFDDVRLTRRLEEGELPGRGGDDPGPKESANSAGRTLSIERRY